MSVVFSR